MKKLLINTAVVAMLGGYTLAVSADEAGKTQSQEKKLEHGKKMHGEHCLKCHDDKVYARENRLIRSLDALSKQVVRCKDNTGVAWFDEDTEAVVHFLNETYYKF